MNWLNWKDIKDWYMDLPMLKKVWVSIAVIILFVLLLT
jgi:hypothetical protein